MNIYFYGVLLMKNVRKIREDKKLLYILPENLTSIHKFNYFDVAIVAYIYYDETVLQYLEYLNNIPNEITTYLISSNEKTLMKLKQFAQSRENVIVRNKKNRGRDISALVISSKDIFQKYKYVCFVHDKKAKFENTQRMTNFWLENLWGNTLKSEEYIGNVLQLFACNPDIGLLVPPEPYYYMQYHDWWVGEYGRTKELAKELNLTKTTIEEEYPPITLGTVFWCKSCIMGKLFNKCWKVEDFAEEPMPNGGTISHAVERIFGYLAQDAGYDTGTIMCESYAGKLIMLMHNEKKEIYSMLNEGLGFSSPLTMWEFYTRKKQIKKYISCYSSIYLFGAGKVGKCYLAILKKIFGYSPKAFLVTDDKAKETNIEGIPVVPFNTITVSEHTGIIISVGQKFVEEIKEYLLLKKYTSYLCIKDLPIDEDIDRNDGSWIKNII